MFKGLIKAIIIFGALYTLFHFSQKYSTIYYENNSVIYPLIASTLFVYLILFTILPYAIVGSIRYRSSRSSWRGIHFKYVGSSKVMFKIFMNGFFLSILTFGFYLPWMMTNVLKEVCENLKFSPLLS